MREVDYQLNFLKEYINDITEIRKSCFKTQHMNRKVASLFNDFYP